MVCVKTKNKNKAFDLNVNIVKICFNRYCVKNTMSKAAVLHFKPTIFNCNDLPNYYLPNYLL